MENTIRIKRNEEDLYRINIADDGTEIVFDLADVGLGIKCDKAFNDVKANSNMASQKIKAIENKYANQELNEKLATQKSNEIMHVYSEMFARNREIMNTFLGNPRAMDCLFGDANYIEMYDDLFKALEPHFKNMELSVEGIKNRIAAKYGRKENVIK